MSRVNLAEVLTRAKSYSPYSRAQTGLNLLWPFQVNPVSDVGAWKMIPPCAAISLARDWAKEKGEVSGFQCFLNATQRECVCVYTEPSLHWGSVGKRGRKYPQRRERNLRVETLKAQKNSGISPALLKSNPQGRHEGNICHRATQRAVESLDQRQKKTWVSWRSVFLFPLLTYLRS